MTRLIGIGLMVLVLYGLLVGSYETARTAPNHLDLARRRGVPILMVTHDPRILDIADRIIAMEDGRILPANEANPVPAP